MANRVGVRLHVGCTRDEARLRSATAMRPGHHVALAMLAHGRSPELNPELALAAALLYVVGADGHLTMSERLVLAKLVPSDRLIDRALDYCRRTPSAEFLSACVGRFEPDQRLCLLLNMDSLREGPLVHSHGRGASSHASVADATMEQSFRLLKLILRAFRTFVESSA